LPPDAARATLLREVESGRLSADAVHALVDQAHVLSRPVRNAPSPALLSAREIDVLRAIAHGASNKEAARELSLSPSTVRTHVENMFRKLGCSTRAAATLKAAALGLL
jgi:DNA-binding NarL/FixJ family response regulator